MTAHKIALFFLTILLQSSLVVESISSYSWQRARPLSILARGNENIIVTGTFNASSAYACQLDSTDPSSVGRKISVIARPASDGTLTCVAPTWTFGAQEVRLSIFTAVGATGAEAVDVRDLVPGPGETADRIAYVAVWKTRSLAEGSAQGGKSMKIEGNGFNTNDADYVCKFVCIHSACNSLPAQRFAVSTVPTKPTTDNQLTCITPMWLFNAFKGNSITNAGTTKLVLEKGGVELPYVGTQGLEGQKFVYFDVWMEADKAEGLATRASTLVSISGYGFDVQADDYSCVFKFTTEAPYRYAASAAIAASSRQLKCYTPHWTTVETTTSLEIYKDNCRGSRGSSTDTACDVNKKVTLDGGIVRFKFIAAVQNLSVASGPASSATPYSITINGAGFTPDARGYSVVLEPVDTQGALRNHSVELYVNGSVTGAIPP